MTKCFDKLLILVFFCGVLSYAPLSHAAKTSPVPDLSESKHPDEPPTQDELDRAKIVNITLPPPISPTERDENTYYYKYRNAVSFRAGSQWAFNDLQTPGLVLGVMYAYPLKDLRGMEAGADLNPEGSGTLHIARREIIGNEAFRWFYKYGVGVRVIGSDQLVTFLRLRNWQIRGGGGFEWTTSDSFSFRFDAEPVFSTETIKIIVSIGVASAF